jgi:hypothetical protein
MILVAGSVQASPQETASISGLRRSDRLAGIQMVCLGTGLILMSSPFGTSALTALGLGIVVGGIAIGYWNVHRYGFARRSRASWALWIVSIVLAGAVGVYAAQR